MTTLSRPIQGVINIENIQGNYRRLALKFKTKGTELFPSVPIDLTEYQSITMEIKEVNNVNRKPFLKFTLDDGLTILGNDNNILVFELNQEFWQTQIGDFVFDIVFVNSQNEAFTFVKGTLNNLLTASKPHE